MPTCHGCRQAISGHYITALDRSWHPTCFRCAGCGRSIEDKRFQARDNQPYHENCYHARFSPRCAGCGQPITGVCISALGKTWHHEHFVCARCGRPFPSEGYHELDGKAYCEDHYWQLVGKRCAIGGEYLKREYVVNGWGDIYCSQHARGLAECYSCQRPICGPLTGGGVSFGDGRSMCHRCRRTAIDTVAQGEPVLVRVRRWMAGLGLHIGSVAIPLRLADQNELLRRSNKTYSKQPSGMASHLWKTRDSEVVERSVEAILILHGLPQEHFAAIAAHELCHTYLFINEFPDLDPMIEEGLCELASYLWLKEQQTPEAAFRLNLQNDNQDPIYGRGFRAARSGYERHGLAAVLRHVRQTRRFP